MRGDSWHFRWNMNRHWAADSKLPKTRRDEDVILMAARSRTILCFSLRVLPHSVSQNRQQVWVDDEPSNVHPPFLSVGMWEERDDYYIAVKHACLSISATAELPDPKSFTSFRLGFMWMWGGSLKRTLENPVTYQTIFICDVWAFSKSLPQKTIESFLCGGLWVNFMPNLKDAMLTLSASQFMRASSSELELCHFYSLQSDFEPQQSLKQTIIKTCHPS